MSRLSPLEVGEGARLLAASIGMVAMSEETSLPEAPETPPLAQYAIWLWRHSQKHREALLKPPVLFAYVVIALCAYWFASSRSSDEISLNKERIAFLNDQIAAYKDRLQGATPDQAARQLSSLQSKLESAEAKLQIMFPDKFRHLSPREIELMSARANDLLGLGVPIIMYASNIGDSLTYLADFSQFFIEKKIPAVGPFPTTCDSSERGVIVGLKKQTEPSDQAKKFMEILKFVGFNPTNTKWMGNSMVPGSVDFTLYICPL